jgi:aminoglycoside phosphotransferase (APT) family kinase protein
MALQEVRFYEQIRPDLGDIAPRAFYMHAGHGARFLLLLEDLRESGARPVTAEEQLTIEHAGGVIDALAQLHAKFWRSPRLAGDLAWASAMVDRPGFELLAGQFRRVRRRFLAESEQRQVSPRTRRMLGILIDHDREIYRSWSDGPQTLVHGDSHMGNTYALPDGRAGLLDWQVVFRTRGVREISYCLVPGLDTDLRRAHERSLLQRYLAGLGAGGVEDPPSFDEAWDDYRFFAHDAWDSVALTVLWSGLHPPAALERAYQRCRTAVEDLAVDEILAARLGIRSA